MSYLALSNAEIKVHRKPLHQAVFLAVIVLALYFPSISAEISLVDDRPMLDSLLNSDGLTLRDIFLPRSAGGGYYRPLIGLSFYLDRMLWLLDERMLHLENLLLHLCNALLVFLLARMIITEERRKDSLAPLLAGILFGVHPLATESVNWISGRTDLLAGLFVLASSLMLLRYRSHGRPLFLAAAGFLFLLGILSKEVAVALVLAVPFLLWPRDSSAPTGLTPFAHLVLFFSLCAASLAGAVFFDNYWVTIGAACTYFCVLFYRGPFLNGDRREVLLATRLFLFTTTLTACSILTAVGVRRLAFSSDVGKFGQALMLMAGDPNYAVSVFLGAVGFYVKKFFLPLPLNLFIVEIDPLYDFIGIGVLLGCVVLAVRRTRVAGLALTGICMLLPALPFAFGTIAWTSYAERYAYIASAFWSVALVIWAAYQPRPEFLKGWTRPLPAVVFGMVVLAFAWSTWNRNTAWQTNTALLADTVSQAPHGKTIRIMYAYALLLEGRVPEAVEQISIARTLYSLKYDETLDMVHAAILVKQGKYDEAEQRYLEAFRRTKGRSAPVLCALVSFYEDRERGMKDQVNPIGSKIAFYLAQLAELTGDPYHCYRAGQYLLSQSDRGAALYYFRKARDRFPTKNRFKAFSARIMDRLAHSDSSAATVSGNPAHPTLSGHK